MVLRAFFAVGDCKRSRPLDLLVVDPGNYYSVTLFKSREGILPEPVAGVIGTV